MANLTGTLTEEQDQLEDLASHSGPFKRRPELRELALVQNTLAILGLVALDEDAGVEGDATNALLERPTKNRRSRRQGLIGNDRGTDGLHHRLHIVARNV